jgi:hypothetical protein
LLFAILHAADIQDRDGGISLMTDLLKAYPRLLKLYADGGYQGPKFSKALKKIRRKIDVEIVKRSDIAKDWECISRNGLAFLRWASARLMLRKLCKGYQ